MKPLRSARTAYVTPGTASCIYSRIQYEEKIMELEVASIFASNFPERSYDASNFTHNLLY
jgi:hypothetical protein